MSDITDTASELEELQRSAAISKVVIYEGISEEFCIDCGIDIPKARQEAIPGVERCIHCAQRLETKTFRG